MNMTESGDNIIVANETFAQGNRTPSDIKFARGVHSEIKGYRDEQTRQIRKESDPSTETFRQCVEHIKSDYESRLRGFGIDVPIDWPEEVHIVPTDSSADIIVGGGLSFLTNVAVAHVSKDGLGGQESVNLFGEENARAVREGLAAVTAAHELYHATAPTIVGMKVEKAGIIKRLFGKKDVQSAQVTRKGMYVSGNEKHTEGDAIEEGMSALAEHRELETIIQSYPLMKDIHELVVKTALEVDPTTPVEAIGLAGTLSKDTLHAGIVGPKDSVRLVKHLREQIPNFDRLTEELRVLRKKLPFARAVEERFGSGSFRKISLATEENAQLILEELKAKP